MLTLLSLESSFSFPNYYKFQEFPFFQTGTYNGSHLSKMYVERNSLKIPPLHMSFKPAFVFETEYVLTLFCLKGSSLEKENVWLIVVNS